MAKKGLYVAMNGMVYNRVMFMKGLACELIGRGALVDRASYECKLNKMAVQQLDEAIMCRVEESSDPGVELVNEFRALEVASRVSSSPAVAEMDTEVREPTPEVGGPSCSLQVDSVAAEPIGTDKPCIVVIQVPEVESVEEGS